MEAELALRRRERPRRDVRRLTNFKHYVTMGHSGLRIGPLCLGAMTFGNEWGLGSEPEEAKRILDAYVDRGGNFIDTANGYTKGHSEVIIGARTLQQLDDNLGVLDVRLTAEQVATLDRATTPALPFPSDMLSAVPTFACGGTTINGRPSKAWEISAAAPSGP